MIPVHLPYHQCYHTGANSEVNNHNMCMLRFLRLFFSTSGRPPSDGYLTINLSIQHIHEQCMGRHGMHNTSTWLPLFFDGLPVARACDHNVAAMCTF